MIVAVAEDWDASDGLLWCFERMPDSSWRRTLFPKAIPVLFGREGLAWGRGRLVEEGDDRPTGIEKTEGDRRAPAGVFRIGRVYGEAPSLPEGSSVDYPYRRVTEWDAWVDDAENPYYNRHVVVDPSRVPDWFEKQRMRLGDPAYAWRLEIRHNADPPVPGKGSAIFFHIRRGENRATHGCTTMRRTDLESIIRWLRVRADPHYALLPRDEYERLRERWGLPELPEE